jgi:hypothetical protein
MNEVYNSQGIPIGNQAEGFIANIFLKEADEALFNLNINFGRYVDDYRVFTKSKNEAIKASIILQEHLLKIGINLNAAKTKIAEAKENIIEIIKKSKLSIISEASFEDEGTGEKVLDKTDLINEIDVGDVNLHDNKSTIFKYQNIFDNFEDIDHADKAEDLCKFLNKISLGDKLETDIFSKQMEWLYQLSIKYPKHSKFYSWLFVKFSCFDYDNEIQFISFKYLFKIFDDEMVNTFIKTRMLHHLVKPRKGTLTYIERISTRVNLKERILEYLTKLMRLKCIALQLNCIYAFYLLYKDHKKVQEFVSENLQRPIPEPIQYAVYQIGTLCVQGSLPLRSFEEILEESDIEDESKNFLFQ